MSKTADAILEGLIESYAEGHSEHICTLIRKTDKGNKLPCDLLLSALMKKLGKEEVVRLLKGGTHEK